MKRDLTQLAQDAYDLLVIGGGIYGACVAWDATLERLSVALIEKGISPRLPPPTASRLSTGDSATCKTSTLRGCGIRLTAASPDVHRSPSESSNVHPGPNAGAQAGPPGASDAAGAAGQ